MKLITVSSILAFLLVSDKGWANPETSTQTCGEGKKLLSMKLDHTGTGWENLYQLTDVCTGEIVAYNCPGSPGEPRTIREEWCLPDTTTYSLEVREQNGQLCKGYKRKPGRVNMTWEFTWGGGWDKPNGFDLSPSSFYRTYTFNNPGILGDKKYDLCAIQPGPDEKCFNPCPPEAPDAPTADDAKTNKAFSKGDPHFKTFGGELYDFHGECDLVLLHNPDFSHGLGMDIHIRTRIQSFWSSIEAAAIKIGTDVMEIMADPESDEWLFFSGKEVTSSLQDRKWDHNHLGDFLVRYKSSGATREANVYLKGSKELLVFKTFKGFVRVDVNHEGSDNYYNSVGLLGSHAHGGKRLGRDGKFIEDVNGFGQEWQVIPELDGYLFHDYEGAVVGKKKCVMPPAYHEGDNRSNSVLKGRRLGFSAVDEAAAEKVCNHLVDPEEKKACVFDIVATQDLNMASTW